MIIESRYKDSIEKQTFLKTNLKISSKKLIRLIDTLPQSEKKFLGNWVYLYEYIYEDASTENLINNLVVNKCGNGFLANDFKILIESTNYDKRIRLFINILKHERLLSEKKADVFAVYIKKTRIDRNNIIHKYIIDPYKYKKEIKKLVNDRFKVKYRNEEIERLGNLIVCKHACK